MISNSTFIITHVWQGWSGKGLHEMFSAIHVSQPPTLWPFCWLKVGSLSNKYIVAKGGQLKLYIVPKRFSDAFW